MPRLLAMLSVVAVFVPSFFMTGVSRSLFVPLSLAVGFAMIASFLLSSSLVPVLSVWWLRQARHARRHKAARRTDWVERLRDRLAACLQRLAPARGLLVAAYVVVTVGVVVAVGAHARPRDLSAERRQGVPASVPRAGRHEVRVDRAAGTRRARRDPRHGRPGSASTSRSATSACSPRRIRSTRSSCGPAARMKACCRWRCGRTRRCDLDDLQEQLRAAFHEQIP